MTKVLTQMGKATFRINKKSAWDIVDGKNLGDREGKFILGCWVDGFGSQTNHTSFIECKEYDDEKSAKAMIKKLFLLDEEDVDRIDFSLDDNKKKKKGN